MLVTSNVIILIVVAIYLLGMLAIGFKYSKNSTSEDFYLGGRKLGPIVTAMSTEASDMSAYLLMGVPGLAFFCGVAEAGWTAIGLSLGTYLTGSSLQSVCAATPQRSTPSRFPTFLRRASVTTPSSLKRSAQSSSSSSSSPTPPPASPPAASSSTVCSALTICPR